MSFLFKKDTALLAEDLVQKFETMTGTYLETYPYSAVAFENAYSISAFTYGKAWLGIFYMLFLGKDVKRKYLFQGLRNTQVLDLLPASQVTIIGGRDEKEKAISKGYGFLWSGGIVAALLIASKKKKKFTYIFQVSLFLKKFRKEKHLFFLIEDTLPVGSFFAVLGSKLKQPAILLQHGFITGTEIMIDGRNCNYNILYAAGQQQFIKNANALSFSLGPAFDVEALIPGALEVILVGTGGKGYIPELYFKALNVYKTIATKLIACGFDVSYRPHPNEDATDYTGLFEKIDKRPAAVCLAGSQKILIGYVSTLLFEAKYFGHGVISILDPSEPRLAYAPDETIDADEPGNVEEKINSVQQLLLNETAAPRQLLKDRFNGILEQIENLN